MNMRFKEELKIYRHNGYYLVANTKGKRKNHTHIKIKSKDGKKEYKTCKTLIYLVNKKRVPKSSYLLQSAIRLTLDRVYKEQLLEVQQRRKQRYFNSQKGVKK